LTFRVCRETGSIETQSIDGTRINGQWNLWSQWGECSQVCNGTHKRHRLCSSPAPECGGEICRKLPDTQIDIVAVGDNQIHEEIEREKCGHLCKFNIVNMK
jgi:hypothetical protein